MKCPEKLRGKIVDLNLRYVKKYFVFGILDFLLCIYARAVNAPKCPSGIPLENFRLKSLKFVNVYCFLHSQQQTKQINSLMNYPKESLKKIVQENS